MTGKMGMARFKKMVDAGHFHIYLQLQPFESIIVRAYFRPKSGKEFSFNETKFPYKEINRKAMDIKGQWTIEFLNGGPVIPSKGTLNKLSSWTELGGDDVKNFSGTAKYSITFQKPPGNPSAWFLDLGQVHETAEFFLNGKKISTLIGPTFQAIIPGSALQPSNKLEIIVANLMANRIAYMDRNNIPWKIFYNTNMPARRRENIKDGLFDASSWKPLPSGLMGPVTLTPVRYE
jgi:hypothetical protein